MKCHFIHTIFIVGIVLISSFSNAQQINLTEENELKFQTHFFEALKQKGIRNYVRAIESLENCYEIDSTDLAVNFEFSKNHFLLKNYYEAEIFIDMAIATAPSNIYLLKHKEAIYKAQRNFQKAIDIQKRIVEIQPEHSDELVSLYILNKNFEKAEKLIEEIEEKALKTSRIKGLKMYLKNRKLASEMINKPPSAVKSRNLETLKKSYSEKKDFKILQEILILEQSTQLFELLDKDSREGLELFPAQPFLHIMNGIALNKLGKYNEAINVLTNGINFVVDDTTMEANFYEQLSISYVGINNKNEALKYKQKAKQLRQID